MAVQREVRTARDFDEFVALPENVERMFEYIGGEIIEVPSNPYVSHIAALISAALVIHVSKLKSGFVTGEHGGYMVSGERYAPDVAYISKARQPELARRGYNPNPPDLAVEVASPDDSEKLLRTKVVNYLAAGTVVWVVYPEAKEVEVYRPGQPVQTVGADGMLDGGDVLSGFVLAVKDIFPD